MTDLEAIFHLLTIRPGTQLASHRGAIARIDIARPAAGQVLVTVAELGASVDLADLLPAPEPPKVYPPAPCPACGSLVENNAWLAHIAEAHAAPREVVAVEEELPFTPEPAPAAPDELPCLVPGCAATFPSAQGRGGHLRFTHGWSKVDGAWMPPAEEPSAPVVPPFSPAPSKEVAPKRRDLSEESMLDGQAIKPEVAARIEEIAARNAAQAPTLPAELHCDECGGRCQVPAHAARHRQQEQARRLAEESAARERAELATYGVIRPGRAA